MDQINSIEESCTLNLKYLKTLPGILRTALLISGLLAIALVGSGINKSAHVEHEFLRDDICKSSKNPEFCPKVWLVELAFSLIVLSWIFTLTILVVKIFSKMEFHPSRKIFLANTVGHVICGLLLAASFVLVLVYVIQTYRFQKCEDKALLVFSKVTFSRDCVTDRKFKFRPDNFIAGMIFALVFAILAFLLAIVDNQMCCNKHHRLRTMENQSTSVSQSYLLSREAEENPEEYL